MGGCGLCMENLSQVCLGGSVVHGVTCGCHKFMAGLGLLGLNLGSFFLVCSVSRGLVGFG